MNEFLAQLPSATAWTASSTLVDLALGFALGALGQSARVIVGLKKTNDEARAQETTFTERFVLSQLVLSLFIGGVAGALASIVLHDRLAALSRETILALVAAGYTGSDFIEGLMRDEASDAKFVKKGLIGSGFSSHP